MVINLIRHWPKPGRGYVVALRLRGLPSPHAALAQRIGAADPR
jgi:hypothetical protein